MGLPVSRTKIVCTIGPASESPDVLEAMLRAGMNVARLNFSHGSFDEHAVRIRSLRAASEATGLPLAIMADLPGPKIRLGRLATEPIQVEAGRELVLTTEEIVGDVDRMTVRFAPLPRVVSTGDTVFLNDGFLELRVVEVRGDDVRCQVRVGGELRSRKGVNLPGIDLGIAAFTEHDRDCLAFAATHDVDAVSQSFVESAADVHAVRAAAQDLGYEPFVIAKIERSRALDNLDAILDAADGLMVARGDLGVEIPVERIAPVQKELIRAANDVAKPVITATQMLESMTTNRRPTRAESTDVANAVLDGTDAVMLSAETAVGKHPVAAVATMARIARAAEGSEIYARRPRLDAQPERSHFSRATAMAAVHVANEVDVDRIVCFSETGNTVRLLSRFRPDAEIIALSPRPDTVRQMTVLAHVRPLLFRREPTLEAMIDTAADLLLARQIVRLGDRVVFVGGVPVGFARSTNVLKLHRIGEDSRFA